MYKLKLINGNTEKIIATCKTIEDVDIEISNKIKEMKFKSYYIRKWEDEKGRIWHDYGSYSTFFVAEKVRG